MNIHCPVDILLVGVLIDILGGADNHEIMKDIKAFSRSVWNLSFGSRDSYISSNATLSAQADGAELDRGSEKNHPEQEGYPSESHNQDKRNGRADDFPTRPTQVAQCFHSPCTGRIRSMRSKKVQGPRYIIECWISLFDQWRFKI